MPTTNEDRGWVYHAQLRFVFLSKDAESAAAVAAKSQSPEILTFAARRLAAPVFCEKELDDVDDDLDLDEEDMEDYGTAAPGDGAGPPSPPPVPPSDAGEGGDDAVGGDTDAGDDLLGL